MHVTATWAARREGNDGFVLETHPDGTQHEFGPMPSHIVPAFIDGRRRVIAFLLAKIEQNTKQRIELEDFSHLKGTPQ